MKEREGEIERDSVSVDFKTLLHPYCGPWSLLDSARLWLERFGHLGPALNNRAPRYY